MTSSVQVLTSTILFLLLKKAAGFIIGYFYLLVVGVFIRSLAPRYRLLRDLD